MGEWKRENMREDWPPRDESSRDESSSVKALEETKSGKSIAWRPFSGSHDMEKKSLAMIMAAALGRFPEILGPCKC